MVRLPVGRDPEDRPFERWPIDQSDGQLGVYHYAYVPVGVGGQHHA